MDVLLALFAVVLLCVFFVLRCRIPAALAPLAALCCVVLGVVLSGLLGVLLPGTVAVYLLCAVLGVFALVYRRPAGWLRKLLRPGFVFFLFASLGVILYLGLRRPLVSDWDEVSLWMTAVKLLKLNNHLYTTAEVGWAWVPSQTPALPSLGYFFSFLGSFAEWKVYAGYDIFMLAVVGATMGALGWRQYRLVAPVAVIGLLTPWFFTVYLRVIYVDNTWITSYGDIPAGMLFGGVLLLYLWLRRAKAPLWPVACGLAVLSLIKDNTFLFSLVAAVIIAVDLLCFRDKAAALAPETGAKAGGTFWQRIKLFFQKHPAFKRLGFIAVLLVASVLSYLVWSRHVGAIVAQRDAAGEVGQTSDDLFTLLFKGLGMLVSPASRTEQFTAAMADMLDAFLHTPITMLPAPKIDEFQIGSGITVSLLCILLFLAATLLAGEKRLRRRTLAMMALSTLGFVGYYLELIISYGLLFKPAQAAALDSYNRYVCPYYIGWFLLAAGCLVVCAAGKNRPFGLANGGVLALCAFMLLRFATLMAPQYTVLGYPDAFYDDARQTKAMATVVAGTIEGDTGAVSQRVFFVSQGDDGRRWFQYSYELLPVILDYSGSEENGGGGGTFGLPGEGEGVAYYHEYTLEEFTGAFEESGCGYLFAHRVDKGFAEGYGSLFADGLLAAAEGAPALYRADYSSGELAFLPVELEGGGGE